MVCPLRHLANSHSCLWCTRVLMPRLALARQCGSGGASGPGPVGASRSASARSRAGWCTRAAPMLRPGTSKQKTAASGGAEKLQHGLSPTGVRRVSEARQIATRTRRSRARESSEFPRRNWLGDARRSGRSSSGTARHRRALQRWHCVHPRARAMMALGVQGTGEVTGPQHALGHACSSGPQRHDRSAGKCTRPGVAATPSQHGRGSDEAVSRAGRRASSTASDR